MREAHALKVAGRLDEAVRRYFDAVSANPLSGAAEHALAACMGEDGRWAEAERHIRAAFAKGLDAPETWLVKGRCELALGRLDGAEAAFRSALTRREGMYEAHRELVQLVWMRTGDAGAALAMSPKSPPLGLVKAEVLEAAGDTEQAFEVMAALAEATPRQAGLAVRASALAARLGRSAEAVAFAWRAQALEPRELPVMIALAEALLAMGEAQEASDVAADIRRTWSTNQHALALQATAWRMLGDQRYRLLCDYPGLVGSETLDTPPGWASLSAYLADVRAALDPLHPFVEAPFGHPLRHGSLATDILRQRHPALKALPRALDGAIRRWFARLGEGEDPARARNRGAYQLRGMWSAKIASGGFESNHVRPQGWLSAVCHLGPATPIERGSWMRFGEPDVHTHPLLLAEHIVEPKPGMLTVFPSFMWRGSGQADSSVPRSLLGFDLLPGLVELPAGQA